MKRFQKALLGVVVSGALLFSAQAAELPRYGQQDSGGCNSAKLQLRWTETGNIEAITGQVITLGFYRCGLRNLSSRTATRTCIRLPSPLAMTARLQLSGDSV